LENITSYLKKNFFTSIAKIITVSLVTLVLLPLIIKKIGLELYGIVSLTLLFSGVSSVIDLGLSKAIIFLTGEKKNSENRVVSSALIITLILITIGLILLVILQLLYVDLLGSELNIEPKLKTLILNSGFLLLSLMLLNNLCKAILEANYLMHIVNIIYTAYTPTLYLSIFLLGIFTNNVIYYILTPLILTFLMLMVNILFIKLKTKVSICKVNFEDVKYVFKNSLGFLNLGLINSIVIPTIQYVFVLFVADVSLYAIFDLSFKIAILANSFIVSLAMPLFAVFSKEIKLKTTKMIDIALKVFYLSTSIYLIILIGFYFLGHYIFSYLELMKANTNLLYKITFILIFGIGSSGAVEVFYRYFMGAKKLKKAFLLKLIVPFSSLVFFLILYGFDYILRFSLAYTTSVILSSVAIIIFFASERKKHIIYERS